MTKTRQDADCNDCPVKGEFMERLQKIDEIHSALYGLKDQPELGMIQRVSRLEMFKKNAEKNHYLQVGFMLGAGLCGGGIGGAIVKIML
jgi:hypothetical protein